MPTRPNAVSTALKSQIARREVILLVVERIVGNVHLAIDAGDAAVGVQRDRRVVVKPGRAALKERSNDRDARLARHLAELGRRWARNRLGQIEEPQVFALAEILRAKKLGQADDVRARARRLANVRDRRRKFASGSGPMRICTRPTLYLRRFPWLR